MIPWCLHFVGNPISCLQIQPEVVEPPIRTIKLVKSDGLVKVYDRPIHVSDLMMEFPKHMVCRSDSLYIGQKIPPLSENDQLQLGHNYFLLPKHFFQTVLSFVTIASFASHQSSRDSRNAFLKKAAACPPFDIQKTASGCPRIRVSDEFISQLMEEGRIKEEENEESLSSKIKSKVCTTPQLQKDYTQLIGLSRQWKPKLETIRETEKRKLSATFGMKRRKKTHSKTTQKSQRSTLLDHHHHQPHATTSTTKPPSKTKIKCRSRKSSSSSSSSS
ncbi:hypothetical protein JRO89_XS14G0140100 [Xanthoceras sorbifolium]|uniref:DUF4228 domain-containing protein n=1 Tax=Xanthoceras sorbifolium TaxID=99658 RepID=A0ABQ8H598_9ROSI|nr:hypothetical protein JRO89_XS14G0140100 [Xanthoceras sorbifolium]